MEEMAYEDNSNPFSLNDFPDELLLGMMIKMNDTSLLNMTRACKRFRAIAKEAFGKKYNTDAYEVKILCDSVIDDEKRYRPFFCTFGENIQAIEITFDAYHPVPEDHWIYDSMQRYCSSLKRLDVASGEGVDLTKILLQQPTLTHLSMYLVEYRDTHWTKHSFPNLQSFQLNDVSGPYNQRRNLEEFFHNNRQLTKLSIENDGNVDAVNIMDSLNGKLPNLRSLDVCFSNFRRYFRPPNKNLVSTVITMEKLEFLSLMGKSRSILGPISKGCKNIQKLKLWSQLEDGEWNDTVSAICSLDKLTKLKINAHNIGVSHLQRIVDRLPNLTRLHLTDISSKSDAFKSLPIIVASSMKLIKLKANDRNEVNWSHEFIKSMAKLTQLINGLKVQITSGRDQLIITRGEVRRCNSIIYCVGNVCINDASTLNLLDLSDPYLEKIISLLDADSLCVLYNSCTRMQKLVKDYISSHVFHVTTIIKENVLHTLGNHISHISVKNVGPDGSVLWPNINRHCPSITELVTTGYRLTITDTLVWPNVKKLIISVYANINYHSVRLFVCPMLEHLEIRFLNADGVQADKFDHEDQYCHLTALKFGCYNEAVIKFLLGLNEAICQQIKFLSLTNISDDEWEKVSNECRQQKRSNSQLINIIMRFRNLSTLIMLVPGVSDLDTQYLFENCTKLNRIEFCHYTWGHDNIFYDLKENCKQIQFIRVVGPRNKITKPQNDLQKLFPGVKMQFDNSS